MRVEMYFDFSCPYAYLASTQIAEICRDSDAELVWQPILLGGVFQRVFRTEQGGQGDSPMSRMSPGKARHNSLDMLRWAEHYGQPLSMPAAHPMRTVRALRALLSLPAAVWPTVIRELYRAYWQLGEDITTEAGVRCALERAGIGEAALKAALAANDDPASKEELRRRTDEAVDRGVFGVPAFFVQQEGQQEPMMFWGQDRLHLVRAALAGWPAAPAEPSAGHGHAASATPARTGTGPALTRSETAPTVHFWYDFSSPFSYLAATQIERVAARTGATLVWRPMLLGAVFRELGTPNVPLLAMSESKRRYSRSDLAHFASYWNVPFRFASRFPMRTVTALRLALLAGPRIADLSHALFRALWVDDRDLDDRDTLMDILTHTGLDAGLIERTQDAEIKAMLAANTAEAVSAGVFGAPTMIVKDPAGDLLFWGQDRLGFVEEALRGWRPKHG